MTITIKSKSGEPDYKTERSKIRIVLNKDKDPRIILTEYYRGESYFTEIPLTEDIDIIDIE